MKHVLLKSRYSGSNKERADYLVMGVEDAGVAELNYLLDTPGSSAVQVALVLAKLDEQAVVDVPLHVLPLEEVVVDAVHLANTRRS